MPSCYGTPCLWRKRLHSSNGRGLQSTRAISPLSDQPGMRISMAMASITSTLRRHGNGRAYDRCGHQAARFLTDQNCSIPLGKPLQHASTAWLYSMKKAHSYFVTTKKCSFYSYSIYILYLCSSYLAAALLHGSERLNTKGKDHRMKRRQLAKRGRLGISSLTLIVVLGLMGSLLTLPPPGTASTLTFTNFVHNSTPAVLWDVMIDDATANLFTVTVSVAATSANSGDILGIGFNLAPTYNTLLTAGDI